MRYEPLAAGRRPRRRHRAPARRWCGRRRVGNVACEKRHGDAEAATLRVGARRRTWSASISSTSASRRAPIEPRATLASYDAGDRIASRLRVSCQTPTGLRDELCAEVLGIANDKVRVLVGDVGGGFGMKTSAVRRGRGRGALRARARSARSSGTPSGIEEFLAATHGRDLVDARRARARRAGPDPRAAVRLARQPRRLRDAGGRDDPADDRALGLDQHLRHPRPSTFASRGVLTNTTPTGAYRGAGRPEAIYIIERLIDAAARQTGIDRVELRRRNMIRPEQMPYKNAMDKTYDSGAVRAHAGSGLSRSPTGTASTPRARRIEAPRPAARARHRDVPRMDGRRVLRGARHRDGERRRLSRSSRRRSRWARRSRPVHAQLAVDVFGVPIERIRIVPSATPTAAPASAARARARSSSAARRCTSPPSARSSRRRSSPPRRSKRPSATSNTATACSRIAGTDRAIGLFDLAGAQPERAHRARRRTSAVAEATWPNGCHVCEVEIDPDDRRRRGRRLLVGQRRRPRGQPDDRRGPARGRRGAGHRPGAVRAGRVRPRDRAAADRQLHGLRAAARGPRPPLRDDHRRSRRRRRTTSSASRAWASSARSARRRRWSMRCSTRSRARDSAASVDALQMPFTPERVWRALNK